LITCMGKLAKLGSPHGNGSISHAAGVVAVVVASSPAVKSWDAWG